MTTTKKLVVISATLAGLAMGISGFVLMQRHFFRKTIRKMAEDFKNYADLSDGTDSEE